MQEACRRLGLRLAEWCASLIEGRSEAHPLNQIQPISGLGKVKKFLPTARSGTSQAFSQLCILCI